MLVNNSKNNAFSIQEFCDSHRISKAMFYVLQHEGKAPKIMCVGRRRLISSEAAAEWRRQMEMNSEVDNTLPETSTDNVSSIIASHVPKGSTRRSNNTDSKKLLRRVEQ